MSRAERKRLAKYGDTNGIKPTPTVGNYVHKCTLSFVKSLDETGFDKENVHKMIIKVEENADCMLHNYINQKDVEIMCRELGQEFIDYINKNFVYKKADGTVVYYEVTSKIKTVTQFIRLYALSFILALDSEGVEKEKILKIIIKACDCVQELIKDDAKETEIEQLCMGKYKIHFDDYVAKHPVFVNADGTLVTG